MTGNARGTNGSNAATATKPKEGTRTTNTEQTMKLHDILAAEPSLIMRESIRIQRRKIIQESRIPTTGAYWWLPIPLHGPQRAKEGIKWDMATFYDNDYNGDTLHMERWPEVLELLAIKWARDPDILKKYLKTYYTGLPRGRVERIADDQNGNTITVYTIAHGNDNPPGTNIDGVINAFNLRPLKHAGRLRVYISPHETMDKNDMRRVQTALGINLGLTGHDVDYSGDMEVA